LCDFGHLADEIRRLEDAGAKALHLDVMDGHFVPNLTYGLPIIEAARRCTALPLETHLMVSSPAEYAEQYHAAGVDAITFHYEAVDDARPLLEKIHSLGAEAGLAINPETPVSAIAPLLDACDLVLVMSVSPGFGGQQFERVALDKLRDLRLLGGERLILEVDGGVNSKTIADCAAAGAQSLIVGSGIFKQADYSAAIRALTKLATAAVAR
jgi:ribulose-phosphate 3-epimerase